MATRSSSLQQAPQEQTQARAPAQSIDWTISGSMTNELARLCTAIADPSGVRARLLVYLAANGPQPAGELAASVGLTLPTSSHHLSRLKSFGLVHSERVAQNQMYSIDPGLANRLSDLSKMLDTQSSIAEVNEA